jgi:hypothetical protein
MKGISIMVVRWNGTNFKNSKPCKHCIEYMRKMGIKKICYSDDNNIFIHEKIKNIKTEHTCMARRVLKKNIRGL